MATKRRGETFQVTVTPKKKTKEDSDAAELVLAPFQPHPKLSLTDVKVGSTARLELIVSNPTNKNLEIEFLNVPGEEKGFTWSDGKLAIVAGDSHTVKIQWKPNVPGSDRYVVGVKQTGRTRNISEIIITASAPEPQGLRKRVLKEANMRKAESRLKMPEPLKEKNCGSRSSIISTRTQLVVPSQTGIENKLGTPEQANQINVRRETFTKVRPEVTLGAEGSVPVERKAKRALIQSNKTSPTNNLKQRCSPRIAAKVSLGRISNDSLEENSDVFKSDELEGGGNFRNVTNENITGPFTPCNSNATKPRLETPDFLKELDIELNPLQETFTFDKFKSDRNLDCSAFGFENKLPSSSPLLNKINESGEFANACTATNDTFSIPKVKMTRRSSRIAVRNSLERLSLDSLDEMVTWKGSGKKAVRIEIEKSNGSLKSTGIDKIDNKNVTFSPVMNQVENNVCLRSRSKSANDKTPDVSSKSIGIDKIDELNFSSSSLVDQDVSNTSFRSASKSRQGRLPVESTSCQVAELFDDKTVTSNSTKFSNYSIDNVDMKSSKLRFTDNSSVVRSVFDESSTSILAEPLSLISLPDSIVTSSINSNAEIVTREGFKARDDFLSKMDDDNLWTMSPPKRSRRTPKKNAAVSSQIETTCMEMKSTVPEKQAVVTSSTNDNKGTGLWNISPQKKTKRKPTTDSPEVLAAPSRTLRKMNPPSSAIVKRKYLRTPRKSEIMPTKVEVRPTSAPGSDNRSLRKSLGQQAFVRVVQSAQKPKPQSIVVQKLPRTRLKLGSTSPCSSSSSSSSSFLKPAEPAELPYLVSPTGQPFIDLSKNPFHKDAMIYLENRWIDETEKELLKWVNKMLSPPLELEATCMMPSKKEMLGVRNYQPNEVKPPPVHRLGSVRRAATALLLSSNIALVLRKVHNAIDKELVTVRADKDLHRDLGLQDFVLRLLLCYHPLWLRVALEAVYGRAIHLHSNSDVVGLVHFIRKHLMSDDYIKEKYSHPTVPFLMLPAFEEKMKKFILNKFIMIVYFLDNAKRSKLIRHDPCLFCKDAPFKESRAILLEFNKELMKGGDMTKYLATMGCQFEHKQSYLEEFDFKVKNRNCMRDGVRLAKLMEIIIDKPICNKLRTPALSKLQKVYNVELALGAYKSEGHEIENSVTAKDIVDGHRERILSLLWQMRGMRQNVAAEIIQLFWILNKDMIKQRMKFLRQKAAAKKIQTWFRLKRDAQNQDRKEFLRKKSAVISIQRRWRARQKMRQEKCYYEKLKVAVRKIQSWYKHTYKGRQTRNKYLRTRAAIVFLQQKYRATKRMEQDREIFRKIKRATTIIQARWKATLSMRKARSSYLRMKANMPTQEQKLAAAIVIQRKWRAVLSMRKDRTAYQKLKSTVAFIEQKKLATLKMKIDRSHYEKLKHATVVIQRRWRAQLEMQNCRAAYQKLKLAVLFVEEKRLATLKMRIDLLNFIKQKTAILYLQRKWRAKITGRKARYDYQNLKTTVAVIERYRCAVLEMRNDRAHYKKVKYATLVFQRKWRANLSMRTDRTAYQKLKSAVAFVERKRLATLKMKNDRSHYKKLKLATVSAQRRWRAKLEIQICRAAYQKLKLAVVFVEEKRLATLKMRIDRLNFIKQKNAILYLQRKWRAKITGRKARSDYLNLKSIVAVIERNRCAVLQMRNVRCHYMKLKSATLVLQRKWRANLSMRTDRTTYQKLKSAVAFVERKRLATLKMKNDRSYYEKVKHATVVIQRWWKAQIYMQICRAAYKKLKLAVVFVEEKRLATIKMRIDLINFNKQKAAILYLQRKWRAKITGRKARSDYQNLKSAVAVIERNRRAVLQMRNVRCHYMKLKSATLVLQRKWRANLSMRTDRTTYQKLKSAVAFVEQKRIATLKMKNDRSDYEKLKHATVVLQRRWRAKLEMQICRASYLKLKVAVMIVEEKMLATLKMRKNKTEFMKLKSLTVYVQQKWRAKLAMRRNRALFIEMRDERLRRMRLHNLIQNRNANVIQTAVRLWLRRRQAGKKERERRELAATKIQAMWRGYYVRKNLVPDSILINIRQSVYVPKSGQTLRDKKNVSINALIQCKSLHIIIMTLKQLDVITTISPLLATELVEDGLIPILYNLLTSYLSRNPGDQDARERIVHILINLEKYPCTSELVWQLSKSSNGTEVLLNMALNFCKSNVKIFTSCVTLIWLWAHHPCRKTEILQTHNLKYVVNRISIEVSKIKKPVQKRSIMPSDLTNCKPSRVPDWGLLITKFGPKVFADACYGWSQLLKKINYKESTV